jgi:hypothetical protein
MKRKRIENWNETSPGDLVYGIFKSKKIIILFLSV